MIKNMSNGGFFHLYLQNGTFCMKKMIQEYVKVTLL